MISFHDMNFALRITDLNSRRPVNANVMGFVLGKSLRKLTCKRQIVLIICKKEKS